MLEVASENERPAVDDLLQPFARALFEMYAGGAVPTSERDLERDARIILDEALNDRE